MKLKRTFETFPFLRFRRTYFDANVNTRKRTKIKFVVNFDKLVEHKTFHKGKSQRILIPFYYLFIHNLLLLTHERQCTKIS